MRLLIFEWGAGTYTYIDVIDALNKMGISHHTVSYSFADMNEDEFFEWRFDKCIRDGQYDAVYSTNYFPLVAKCCHKNHIRYISWSYDNPLDVPRIGETLGFEENEVYLFDRISVEKYNSQGFRNVHHLPLAANTDRLSSIKLSNADMNKFASEISFVGKLYDNPLSMYMPLFTEYTKGYIDSIIESQGKIYGYYFVDEMLTDEFIDGINKHFRELKEDTDLTMTKEALSYAIGAQVTRNERLMILKLLSMHHQLKLYTREDNELLRSTAQYMGSCNYLDEMPKIFKASKINLNINLKVSQSGIPLRVMDVCGSGGFLLSNFQIELAENFVHERDVVMYESVEDAYAKADYYLKHEDERARIAINGYNIVKENFSYVHQLGKILN